MSESSPQSPEHLTAADLFLIAVDVPDALTDMIATAHPVQTYGLRRVANEACVISMPQQNRGIANNLSVLTYAVNAVVADHTNNHRYYTEAIQLGGGLGYAASQIQFDGSVPELPQDIADMCRPKTPTADNADTSWLNTLHELYDLGQREVDRDPRFNAIIEERQKYVSHPKFVPFYRIAAGYVKHQVARADAHHRLHAANIELAALEQAHGTDLSELFNDLPDNFRDNPSSE